MRKAALSLFTSAAVTMIAPALVHAEIPWQTNLRAAHVQAKSENKLLLLHFYTDNCSWCERLEEGSFKAPQVGEAIGKDFVPVKVHATRSPKLTEMFKVTKFPTDVIVVPATGKVLAHSVSPQLPDRYVSMLSQAVPGSSPDTQAIAAQPTPSPAAAAAPGPGVPNYATAAAPQSVTAATDAASGNSLPSGFQLPEQPAGQVPGQLAGVKTNSLSMELPAGLKDSIQDASAAVAAAGSAGDLPSAAPSAAAPAQASAGDIPELAMDGFCPVTVIREQRWTEGSPEYGVIHLGKLYLFVSEQAMQTFLADPAPFTPVLNEIDVVRFFEEKKIVPGKREWGVKDPVYNRMFFFADEAARNHFEKSYDRYTDAAIEVMEKAIRDANPGT
jgi:protein disulfide-isomerase